jgi:xanthine dehydrogenase accessory factor
VGKAAASLGKFLGFRVAVCDDRPEFCTPEAVPDGDEFYPVPLAELPEKLRFTPSTYLVLVTRGTQVDVAGLPAILEQPAAYIGIIGSRRRWETTRKELLAAGISEEKLAKVISPMGLELNAETPEEIAVSILAEIIMLKRGGSGGRMKHEPKK